jgi:hypothetical protein
MTRAPSFHDLVPVNPREIEDLEAIGETLANDLLRGVKPISRFIGETPRKTYNLLEHRRIPAGKQGAIWIASKSVLRSHYAKLTAGEPDDRR